MALVENPGDSLIETREPDDGFDDGCPGGELCVCVHGYGSEIAAGLADGSMYEIRVPETILEEAQRLVYGDRQADYGHPRANYEAIAGLFQAYLVAVGVTANENGDEPVTAADAGMLMLLMKIGRLATGSVKRDTVVDLAGYAAVVARILDVDP